MSATRRLLLPILLLLPFSSNASSQTADTSAPAFSETVSPQIVRLSYVEGDVRLARGKKAAKETGDDWDKAAVDVPLEAGFTLVTGTGRAEIEFEDASTAYLADNSVLTFTKLNSKAGLTDSEMNLLSGSMTVHLSVADGSRYLVTTPANRIRQDTAGPVYFRIDSYLDGTAVTTQDNETLYVANSATGEVKAMGMRVRTYSTQGHTAFFPAAGMPMPRRNDAAYRAAHAEWDSWVANRVSTREAALNAVMKQAGLTAPVPGLAELKDQGTFFDCGRYDSSLAHATCWEPAHGWDPAGEADSAPATASRGGGFLAGPAHLMAASYQVTGQGPQTLGQLPNQAGTKSRLITEDDYFPCSPYGVHAVYQRDPITGRLRLLQTQTIGSMYPFGWAVCHSGTWMRHQRRLVWVPGRKPCHHPPVHWVKAAGKVGYVPMHPKDVAGKPPVNLKDGVFAVTDGKHGVVERLEEARFTAGKPVELLTEAPKQFRSEPVAPLLWVEAPKVGTRLMAEAIAHPGQPLSGQPITGRHTSYQLTFNQRSQGFNLARTQELAGGKSTVVSMPFSNRGGAIASGAGSARASLSGGGGSARVGGVASSATISHSSSFSGGSSAVNMSHASSAPSSSSSFSASTHH
jgi:hypothetical protein